jgi:phosphoenolpyruvate carboxylase
MSNLVRIVNQIVEQQKTNEVEQASTNGVSSSLNYQFMYKQLESAVEEIIIQYPNDPIVNELKQKLVRNLRPILELIQNDPNQNFDN